MTVEELARMLAGARTLRASTPPWSRLSEAQRTVLRGEAADLITRTDTGEQPC